jgi:5-methylcytosine-specific restriction endonuclease McrA
MKTCPKCLVAYERSLDNFPPSKQTKDGLGGYCRACQYALNKAWRVNNPIKAKAAAALWREKNADKEYERLKADRLANPQRCRDRVKKSYYKNHAKRLAARADYRIRNLEKEKEYARNYTNPNPLSIKEKAARIRLRKRGIFVDPIDYAAILVRDASTCHLCKLPVEAKDLVFDHVIPLSKGGSHTPQNVSVSHYVCNRKKGSKIL